MGKMGSIGRMEKTGRMAAGLLAAALLLSLSACGRGDAAEQDIIEETVAVASSEPTEGAPNSASPVQATPTEAIALNYVVHEYGESDSVIFFGDTFNSTIQFPTMGISTVDEEIRNWAMEVDQSARKAAEENAAAAQEQGEDYSASLEYSYSAYLVKNRFVGVEEMGFFEESSAAHPVEPIKTFNVDLAGKEILDNERLFYVNKQGEVLSMLTERLKSTAAALGMADGLDLSALADAWMDNVLLRGDGVDFLFEAGRVLPHSAGVQRVFFSYGELRPCMTLGDIMQQNAEATPDPALINPPVVVVQAGNAANEAAGAATDGLTPGAQGAETEGVDVQSVAADVLAAAGQSLAPNASESPALTGEGVMTDKDGVPYATGPPRELDPDKPMVALTFDDGPSRNTPDIIELFEQYGGRGTFFMVGNRIQQYSEVTKQVLAQGSEIASHTWDHKNLTSISNGEIRQEFQQVIDVVESITGARPRFVRPPYGAVDDNVKKMGAEMNITYVNWNIDTLDWKTRDARATYDAIMKDVKDGDIVLCHDLHDATGEAMKLVIPELARQGYQMVTVSELFEAKGIDVEAGTVYRHG